MTTLGTSVEAVRRHLYGGTRPELNRLNANVTDSATTLTLTYSAGTATRNSYISIGGEVMFVWVTSSTTLTVQRGMLGTTATAHTAGATIEVNPRIPRPFVLDALVEELRSWGTALPRVVPVTYAFSGEQRAMDLGALYANAFYVAAAFVAPAGDASPSWPRAQVRLARSTDFASGVGLVLPYPPRETVEVQVHLALPMVLSSPTEATTWTAVGLPSEWADIAALGAAVRLVAPRDISRSDPGAQGEPRRSEEVPPGFALQTATALKRLRDARIAEARNDLLARFPIAGW